ncbi:MAG: hypothetical protein ACM3P1_00990 [Candidatus Saccharibacteria bacterium]
MDGFKVGSVQLSAAISKHAANSSEIVPLCHRPLIPSEEGSVLWSEW